MQPKKRFYMPAFRSRTTYVPSWFLSTSSHTYSRTTPRGGWVDIIHFPPDALSQEGQLLWTATTIPLKTSGRKTKVITPKNRGINTNIILEAGKFHTIIHPEWSHLCATIHSTSAGWTLTYKPTIASLSHPTPLPSNHEIAYGQYWGSTGCASPTTSDITHVSYPDDNPYVGLFDVPSDCSYDPGCFRAASNPVVHQTWRVDTGEEEATQRYFHRVTDMEKRRMQLPLAQRPMFVCKIPNCFAWLFNRAQVKQHLQDHNIVFDKPFKCTWSSLSSGYLSTAQSLDAVSKRIVMSRTRDLAIYAIVQVFHREKPAGSLPVDACALD
ncbi:hypothetical protein BU17DRAFT_72089 [Hysterangium stoloniferum]|nr:hypothetical protein BU17DRAFT_72089 [Hysterangium stoloniferum]